MSTFAYARIDDDGAGGSRMETIDVDFGKSSIAVGDQTRRTSLPIVASHLIFAEVTEEEAPPAWHPTPFCLFSVILAGSITVETTDGTIRRFGPGDVCMSADVRGQGHRTRVVDAPLRMLVVAVADSIDASG